MKTLTFYEPVDLIEVAKFDTNVATLVLNDEYLLNKLGCNKEKGKIYGSTYFWKQLIKGNTQDPALTNGYYLFSFLSQRKEIYEKAIQKPEIAERLSDEQKEALYFRFYKRNVR